MADDYVSMDEIRAKKSIRRQASPQALEDVYDDPQSFVSSEGNASPSWDTPSCSGTSEHSTHSDEQNDAELQIPTTRKIVLHPGPAGLGMSIAGGVKSPMGLLPVFITDIDPGGLVERSQEIKVGDTIVSVNGESMQGKTHRDVVLAIKAANSSLILEVMESPENIMKFISLE